MADQNMGVPPDTGSSEETRNNPAVTPPVQQDGPPAPLNVPPSQTGKLGDDIANILKGVKLPERRDAAPKKQIENKAVLFDTELGAQQPASQEMHAAPTPSITVPPTSFKPQTPAAPATPSVRPAPIPAPASSPAPAPAPISRPTIPQPDGPALQTISKMPIAEQRTPAAPAMSVMPHTAQERPVQKMPQGTETVTAVHTLKDDLQNVVHDQKISVVRAVSLEENRRSREKSDRFAEPVAPPRKSRATGILFTALILLALGGAALFGVYTVMQSKSAPPPALTHTAILFAESSVNLNLTGQPSDTLKRQIAAARSASQGALGSITEIVPTVTVTNSDGSTQVHAATFGEFMQAIGAHPPDGLLRALGDNFFFGIHTVDTNAPLFVIPVTSYDRAFAGMLAWEGSLNKDLAPMFTAVPEMTTDQSGLPVNRTFQDAVMRNYDVRALKDDAGNIKLYYSFPTQEILVIAESPYSFAEVLSRLQAARGL